MSRVILLVCSLCAFIAMDAPEAFAQARCQQGFVWREAFAGDYVCVPPETRSQAARDNSLAASRVQPGGGAYGAATCRSGFVWREARQGDLVCVTPETRAQAAEDNRLASTRIVGDAGQPGFSIEQNVDRPGGDYANFDMPQGGWQACRDACRQDGQCRAFTYVRPGVQSSVARCWLKNTVPAAGSNGCCVSGVRAGGAGNAGNAGSSAGSAFGRAIDSSRLSRSPADPPAQGTRVQAPQPARNDFYCRQYAQRANNDFRTMQRFPRCRIPAGGRWQDNFDVHYDWCVSAPREQAIGETRAREQHLRDCGVLHSY